MQIGDRVTVRLWDAWPDASRLVTGVIVEIGRGDVWDCPGTLDDVCVDVGDDCPLWLTVADLVPDCEPDRAL